MRLRVPARSALRSLVGSPDVAHRRMRNAVRKCHVMPVRSTLLQRVVFQIHRQLAPEADVQESAFLPDRATGGMREVDVVVRSTIGDHEIILSVECRDHARKATVEWVEQMATKHQSLPTSKLILLSRNGFSSSAALKARSLKIDTYSFADAADTNWTTLLRDGVNAAFDLWACRLRSVLLVFVGDEAQEYPAPPETAVFCPDGTFKGSLRETMRSATENAAFTERAIDYALSSGESIFSAELAIQPPVFADHSAFGCREIRLFRLCVEAIKSSDIHLAAAKYRDTAIVYGEGESPAGPFTISFTRPSQKQPTGTISVVDPETGSVRTAPIEFQSDDTKLLFLTGPIGKGRSKNTA